MKQILILLLSGVFLISISCQNKKGTKDTEPKQETTSEFIEERMEDAPDLRSISEIRAVFESADVGFYPEIINDPLKAMEYQGNKKIAANLGVYFGDMLYVIATTDKYQINQQYGAVMELSKNFGLTDELPKLILERFAEGNTSIEETYDALEKALNDSEKNLTTNDKAKFYTYYIFGNYIEKLYIVSSLVKRPKQTDVPAEVEAQLKRGLLNYMAKQSVKLERLLKVLKDVPDVTGEVVVLAEVEALYKSYKDIESKREEILALGETEFYKAKEVVTIQDQIEVIRNRIVN